MALDRVRRSHLADTGARIVELLIEKYAVDIGTGYRGRSRIIVARDESRLSRKL